jgi:bile acid:Na+ symporter, BASS family
VPLLAPDTAVNPVAIAIPLALTLLLPLVAGLLVTQFAVTWARRLQPLARHLSTVMLVLLLTTTVIVNAQHFADLLASRVMFAVLAFVLGALAIGYLIASPHPERRVVLGLGTAMRNIAAATVVASEDFRGSDALLLVIVASMLSIIMLLPTARWLRAPRGRSVRRPQVGSEPLGHGSA